MLSVFIFSLYSWGLCSYTCLIKKSLQLENLPQKRSRIERTFDAHHFSLFKLRNSKDDLSRYFFSSSNSFCTLFSSSCLNVPYSIHFDGISHLFSFLLRHHRWTLVRAEICGVKFKKKLKSHAGFYVKDIKKKGINLIIF